jgi:hypothetical protein
MREVCLIPAATAHSAWTAILCLTASLFFLELVIGPRMGRAYGRRR